MTLVLLLHIITCNVYKYCHVKIEMKLKISHWTAHLLPGVKIRKSHKLEE